MVLTNTEPIMRIQGLTKMFGGVAAVKDVDIDLFGGNITSLIGPNGAGKTTLFNVITGLMQPTEGKISFGERDITGWRPDLINHSGIARTFQNIRLFTDLSVLDNVKVGLHPRTKANFFSAVLRWPARAEEKKIVSAAVNYLDFVDLVDKVNEMANNLAYGEQRRLEIARALATHPRLLLLDEPAAGMNPMETDTLMTLIQKIRNAGIKVFLIEHDMRLVMKISDQIHVLDHGVPIAHGTPAEIQKNQLVIDAYLGVQMTDEQCDQPHPSGEI